ncbi:hypothetical protein GS501_06760 [Saccharibacter sp. 17.LH.SD]|uniref:hypothetical protein n=1 Tax=Saccharibacter sp. 17.LH.SD TaxID=2689393 RepID=UPI00137182C1|nr:hypothetical protein [Saccharibacter sp. 17.LH.SD]MXV44739.1 hypothetical protein [Saccharibacter sp. 17.LH.SD]
MNVRSLNMALRSDTLEREEQTALWVLRCLLGPRRWRSSVFLEKLFGTESERLQERFRTLFLHTIWATSSLELSSTEAHLLQVLADIQNSSHEEVLISDFGKALKQLGLTLAAYGYWLPSKKSSAEIIPVLPQDAMVQDNHPSLMQAAE